MRLIPWRIYEEDGRPVFSGSYCCLMYSWENMYSQIMYELALQRIKTSNLVLVFVSPTGREQRITL